MLCVHDIHDGNGRSATIAARDDPSGACGRDGSGPGPGGPPRTSGYSRTLLASALLLSSGVLMGEPVTVRHTEGLVHGFLALRTLDGSLLADGDLIQVARGNRVTSQIVFHFKDGSLHDETTVFTQRQRFRLLSDHLVQKGPTFPQPLDMTIDGVSGQVTVRYADEHGQQKSNRALDLPPDVANGLIPTLLKNVRPDAPPKTLSLVARPAEAAPREAGDHDCGRGPVLDRRYHSEGDALRSESGNRRHCRIPCAARWQTTTGLAGVDPRRDSAGLREIGTAAVSRRTAVAHRARESGLAAPAACEVERRDA